MSANLAPSSRFPLFRYDGEITMTAMPPPGALVRWDKISPNGNRIEKTNWHYVAASGGKTECLHVLSEKQGLETTSVSPPPLCLCAICRRTRK